MRLFRWGSTTFLFSGIQLLLSPTGASQIVLTVLSIISMVMFFVSGIMHPKAGQTFFSSVIRYILSIGIVIFVIWANS